MRSGALVPSALLLVALSASVVRGDGPDPAPGPNPFAAIEHYMTKTGLLEELMACVAAHAPTVSKKPAPAEPPGDRPFATRVEALLDALPAEQRPGWGADRGRGRDGNQAMLAALRDVAAMPVPEGAGMRPALLQAQALALLGVWAAGLTDGHCRPSPELQQAMETTENEHY